MVAQRGPIGWHGERVEIVELVVRMRPRERKALHYFYRQLDGAVIHLTACTCGPLHPLACPIDGHRITWTQRNPMWEFLQGEQ